jgi:hypothetical protein
MIDPDNVSLVSEEEDAITFEDEDGNEVYLQDDDIGVYNEYITYFYIKTPNGDMIKFSSSAQDNLYISTKLNNIIRKKASPDGGMVNIPLSAIMDDTVLFYIKINNSEISKTMDDIINVINKSAITENMTKDEALQTIVDLVIDGHLTIDSVHLEVILSNQIVDPTDSLKRPNWDIVNPPYQMFTLKHALTNNNSVIVSLLFSDLHKTLYSPLTFSKTAPSFFDLFFCEQPQNYISSDLLDKNPVIDKPQKGIEMIKVIKDKK